LKKCLVGIEMNENNLARQLAEKIAKLTEQISDREYVILAMALANAIITRLVTKGVITEEDKEIILRTANVTASSIVSLDRKLRG